MKFFETEFLDTADKFLSELDPKIVRKVLYNIDLAEQTHDPKLLKKLSREIWEFRTKYSGLQIRLLAFWDKREKNKSNILFNIRFVCFSNGSFLRIKIGLSP